jgi:WD40 repeat protein
MQAVIPPNLMLPERRLEELVEQALVAQITNCRFHNDPGARPSLLSDYSCGTEQIPTCTTQVLLDHTDEVWHLSFSHNGRMLASCGKDQTAIIWDVERRGQQPTSNGSSGSPSGGGGSAGSGSSRGASGGRGSVVVRRHVLRGHSGPIAFLCWSPDDSKLATCGQDALRLWDTATGKCLAVFVHHTDPVTCAAWFPDGKSLVTGSHDKQLCVVDLDGVVKRQWRIQRIQEVLVAKGGRYILATTCERKVRVYDLETDTESYIPEGETLISMSLSRDGRYLLVNLTSNTMHLWDLGAGPEIKPPPMPCARFEGRNVSGGQLHSAGTVCKVLRRWHWHVALDYAAWVPTCSPRCSSLPLPFHPSAPQDKQSRFVVRSCLGGLDDRFVLTGSEECRVYVYHRNTGERLLELEGHSGTVNSVAWNPTDPAMFASASDDKSIHIWQPAAVAAAAGVTRGLQ